VRDAFRPEQPRNSPEVERAFEAVDPLHVAEILGGELHVQPRPRAAHSHVTSRLNVLLGPFEDGVDGPGGWIILIEPELHLGPHPDKVVPDLAGWRIHRFPLASFAPDAPVGITVAPDWVCEVLSDRTEAIDRGKKIMIYRRETVRHVWFAHPHRRTVEIYRLTKGQYVLAEVITDAARVRAEPFDAIEIDLARLWSRVPTVEPAQPKKKGPRRRK
jgi:Uma2 family endonuclease